jgi:hypothetical protein
MIPKYYTCIMVSHVKAPLIKPMLLSFLHKVVLVQVGGESHVPQEQSQWHALFQSRHQLHPSWYACQAPLLFCFLQSEVLDLIFQHVLINKHQ